ncbi:MAG: transporter substrate-binding domain-containing protein [Rhodoferax sp.]|uniref:substrate-binding periplasmic protein n=1 Tax=Rhodoferax sp. TaxID=50421 RepID=UPI003262EDE2
MSRLLSRYSGFALVLLCHAAAVEAYCNKLIVTADPAYPPMHWYDGEHLQGASIEIAKRVLDELQIPYEVRYVGPFARLIKLAERGEVDMVATLKKTPERERFLLYTKLPALSNPVAVFQSREHSFFFQGRDDLVGRKGGITRGNMFGDDFDNFLNTKLNVETADNPENNFNKLKLGRIDYFITGYYVGMAYLLKRGDEQRFTAMSPYVVDTPNYLALAQKGNCSDKLEAIDNKLAQLAKSGVIDELVKLSFAYWKAHPTVVEK